VRHLMFEDSASMRLMVAFRQSGIYIIGNTVSSLRKHV